MEDAVEERQAILKAIRAREESMNRYLESYVRLRVEQQVSKWGSVGCQLCFVLTREPQPDYTMDECRLWDCCDKARDIKRWLENYLFLVNPACSDAAAYVPIQMCLAMMLRWPTNLRL